MEHAEPFADLFAPELADDPAGPWRRATVIASALAVVELVLLVIAGLVLLGRPLSHHVQAAAEKQALATPAPKPHAATPVPVTRVLAVARLTRAQTQILVLNGNGQPGAAGAEASRAQARGYRVAAVGNASRRNYARTIVMYRPGYRPEAKRLAHDLGVAIVAPVDGLRPRSLHGAQLVVLLGNN